MALDRLSELEQFDAFFRLVLRAILIKLSEMEDGSDEVLYIGFYCRSGEKRSVACAAIAHSVCVDFLGCRAEPIDHRCSHEWSRRRNCPGKCDNCIWPSAHESAQRVGRLWDEEAWRMGYLFDDAS